MRTRNQIGLQDEIHRPVVEQVFEYWKVMLDHPRSRLDPVKFRTIAMQLDLGYSLEDLQLVIEGAAVDPWPERKYNDQLDVIFRSANMEKLGRMGEEAREWSQKRMEARQKQEEAAKARADFKPQPMPSDTKAILEQFKRTLVKR